MEKALPAIPAKRYFTIGEVSELCGVKPYVLRYWEQEFTQLRPVKRRGNRRYYQHHEVLLIRRIRELLYEQGFTISGARNRLSEVTPGRRHDDFLPAGNPAVTEAENVDAQTNGKPQEDRRTGDQVAPNPSADAVMLPGAMRHELLAIRELLKA